MNNRMLLIGRNISALENRIDSAAIQVSKQKSALMKYLKWKAKHAAA